MKPARPRTLSSTPPVDADSDVTTDADWKNRSSSSRGETKAIASPPLVSHPMLEAIDHVCLVVSDLDRMADFYTRLLDMRITRRVTISGDWIDRTVGLEGVVADVIYLDPPTGPRVELIHYHEPVAPRAAGLGDSNLPGLRH